MKVLTKLLVAVCFIGGATIISYGQDEEGQNPQLLMVHVDHVITAKAMQYEEASKGFNEACKKHEIKNLDMWAHKTSNGDYMFVSLLENMAVLDNSPISGLKKKMGDDAWDAMYGKFNDTYLEHESFIIHGHPELSYNADQLGAEGVNYRVWTYYYFEDKNWENVMEISKKWKELYESKNIESGYTVYTSGLGFPGPVIVYMKWAKTPAEYYAQNEKINKILGEEGEKLWKETRKYIYKQEKVDGWFKPAFSYISTPQ